MVKTLALLSIFTAFAAAIAAAEEIHLAAKDGDIGTIKALLAEGVPVDLPSTLDTSDVGVSPLYEASKWGKLEAAELLLDAGADPTFYSSSAPASDTPISVAVKYGRTDIVKLFLKRGVDPNSSAPLRPPPLHWARKMKRPEIADMLVEHGAQLSIREAPISSLLANADVKRGARLARTCWICHPDPKTSARHSAPNLRNIVGREKAIQPGFDYSEALKEFGGMWTYDNLNSFLAQPGAFIPGTSMEFVNLGSVEFRLDVIAYLRTLSDSPAPFPRE